MATDGAGACVPRGWILGGGRYAFGAPRGGETATGFRCNCAVELLRKLVENC